MPLKTDFAPAERLGKHEMLEQVQELNSLDLIQETLDIMPEIVVVLNTNRQVVWGNIALFSFLGIDQSTDIAGIRLGEALQCIHSVESEHGCGTAEACRFCGAVNAMLAAISGKKDKQECRVVRMEGLDPLDLRVWTSPFLINSESYLLLVASDIRHEKRRKVLERTFFHDVLNTATGVKGLSEMLTHVEDMEREGMVKAMSEVSSLLVNEIRSQQILVAAENGELSGNKDLLDSIELLEEMLVLYRNHPLSKDVKLKMDQTSDAVECVTDQTLIYRVLGNMLKNAVEASRPGDVITIGCKTIDAGRIEFWVNNPLVMPKKVELQMFQRSFSTKGAGRGVGTYSMKLFTEKYLGGEIGFITREGIGTTFHIRIPTHLPDID